MTCACLLIIRIEESSLTFLISPWSFNHSSLERITQFVKEFSSVTAIVTRSLVSHHIFHEFDCIEGDCASCTAMESSWTGFSKWTSWNHIHHIRSADIACCESSRCQESGRSQNKPISSTGWHMLGHFKSLLHFISACKLEVDLIRISWSPNWP